MARIGMFRISWNHDPRRDRADTYKITFILDEEPDRELVVRKCSSEVELEQFLTWEAGCEDAMVKRAIADLRQGREVTIRRNGLNQSSADTFQRLDTAAPPSAPLLANPDEKNVTPEIRESYPETEGELTEEGNRETAEMVMAAPQTVEDTGISTGLLADLAMKLLFTYGEQSLSDLSRHLGLSFGIVDEIFEGLRKEQFLEVKGMVGLSHRVALTDRGRSRALELLSLNKYAGRAPVSLRDYTTRIKAQSVTKADVRPSGLQQALAHLVLDAQTIRRLGAAVVSGTSILLYGPSGTGKTSIAEVLPNVYQDSVWVPYALEVAGQIITVFDRGIHDPIEQEEPLDGDGRWVLCRRPRVIVGGELTGGMLDLHFDPVSKLYSAPIQMKANNGVLVVDDFGRQLVRPEDLLNRWIVPLDRGIDFITLGGGKFEIPFDQFLVFASNLNPGELGDEAFLRRLTNKIKIDYLRGDQFHQIFRLQCAKLGLVYDVEVVDYAIKMLAEVYNEPLRACQPRDIVRQICWTARYERRAPKLDRESIADACRNHFDHDAGSLPGVRDDDFISRRKTGRSWLRAAS